MRQQRYNKVLSVLAPFTASPNTYPVYIRARIVSPCFSLLIWGYSGSGGWQDFRLRPICAAKRFAAGFVTNITRQIPIIGHNRIFIEEGSRTWEYQLARSSNVVGQDTLQVVEVVKVESGEPILEPVHFPSKLVFEIPLAIATVVNVIFLVGQRDLEAAIIDRLQVEIETPFKISMFTERRSAWPQVKIVSACNDLLVCFARSMALYSPPNFAIEAKFGRA
jgi:hypothetical protein